MKFRTADLIARIDALIEERKAVAEARTAEDKAAAEKARQDWLVAHSDAYVEFANRIKDKIRKGRPITMDDRPDGLRDKWQSLPFFDASKPKVHTAQTADLETLRATLTAVEDEYVTTTSLREIGFKDVARLFRAMS